MNQGILPNPVRTAGMPASLLGNPQPFPTINAKLGRDFDAQRYIDAVERADGQALEEGVKEAIDAFVIGCKLDGLWRAIRASCILLGARTLSGALTPLSGTAPTNFNFVSGDYNRRVGLQSDGSTKYLSGSTTGTAQANHHLYAYVTASIINGFSVFSNGGSLIRGTISSNRKFYQSNSGTFFTTATGLNYPTSFGLSRSEDAGFFYLDSADLLTYSLTTRTQASTVGYFEIFRQQATISLNCRIAFYSAGTSIDLTKMHARTRTLYAAVRAGIT